jgi:hypothetical protein
MNWAYVVIAALCSGLLSGLLGVVISNRYFQRNEIRRAKLLVLQQLLGKRHCLLPDVTDRGIEQKFTEALNQVFVVFHDCREITSALKEFHEAVMNPAQHNTNLLNQKLLDLFKAMCKHLNIDTAPLNDNFFLMPLNVKRRIS